MLTDLGGGRAAAGQCVDRSAIRPTAESSEGTGDGAAEAAPRIRLSDLLSADPQKFLDRQWQPFGE
jgi:hypothetical protein